MGLFFQKIDRDAKANPEAYYHLRYEDLVSSPEASMKAVCAFSGINYQTGILNFYEKKDDVVNLYQPAILQKYHASLLKKINTTRIGLWKTQLSDTEVKQLSYTVGSYAQKAGYKRKYTHFGVGIVLKALPGRVIAALLYVATQVADKLPATIRMNILSKDPRVLGKAFLRVFNPNKLVEMNRLENGR